MKLHTKLKILRFVKRILKMDGIIRMNEVDLADTIRIRTSLKYSRENTDTDIATDMAIQIATQLVRQKIVTLKKMKSGLSDDDFVKDLYTVLCSVTVVI